MTRHVPHAQPSIPGPPARGRRYPWVLAVFMAVLISLGGLVLPGARVSLAAPSLQLSRSHAAPGDTINVTGYGFSANDSAVVSLDVNLTNGQVQHLRSATATNANGGFTTKVTLPKDTIPSTYSVKAKDFHNHSAAKDLTVLPLVDVVVGQKTPPVVTVVADADFFVSGSGFTPGESIAITATVPLYNGNQVVVTKSATANKAGAFDHVLAHLPRDAKAGDVTLTVTGASSKKSATATIKVVYRPSLSLDPSTTRPNGNITATIAGFVPNSSVTVSVPIPQSGGSTVTVSKNVQTDDKGAATATLNLPLHTQTGTYTVSARDTQDGLTAHAQLRVTLSPVLTIKPTQTAPGQSVTLTGSGFSAQAQVTIHGAVPLFSGGATSISQTARTDKQGNFKVDVRVPSKAAAVSIPLRATGPNGAASATLKIAAVNVRITLSPRAVRPGTATTVHGAGFPAGDTVTLTMTVKLSGGGQRTVSLHATADNSGSFTAVLHVPGDTAVGIYQVRAQSGQSGRAPTARLVVSVNAGIQVNPSSVTPGSSFQVNGGGFGAGVDVTVSASVPLFGGGSRTVSTHVHTGPKGGFATKLTVPQNAASGTVTVTAQGPNATKRAQVVVQRINVLLTLTPVSAIPGSTVTVSGSGLPGSDTVTVSTTINLAGGGTRTLSATAKTGSNGHFSAQLSIPGDAAGGTYTVKAVSQATGRAPQVRLSIVTLKPSVVLAPVTVAPGSSVTVNGFGFAASEKVSVSLAGHTMTTATADAAGKLTVKITVPSDSPSGTSAVALKGSAGHSASANLSVNRAVSTTLYFASLYTGTRNQERLAILNPSNTRARVTIKYQLSNGTVRPFTVEVNGHTRYTRDVNADLGAKVAAAAVVQADVPIAAEHISYQSSDGVMVPGVRKTSSIWYFANGNTSGNYRVYIAVQNPNSTPVNVTFRILPTHYKPIVVTKTMAPTSRLTLKVNKYVRDAVGIVVRSSAPIVANRTIKIRHGVDGKIGATAPHTTWYFAGGSTQPGTREYIGVINPNNATTQVTLHVYAPDGQEIRTLHTALKRGARLGYNINKIAHRTDVAAALTASRGVVAEQTSYIGKHHDATTDTFGVTAPAKTWAFAGVNTTNARNESSIIDLFNPGLAPAPIVLQFMSSSGQVTQRTYIVGPLQHQRVDVRSVEPNAQLGVVASSSSPFVALNRSYFNGHAGSMTSQGISL